MRCCSKECKQGAAWRPGFCGRMAPLPPIQPHNLTRWRRELRLAHLPYLTVDAPRAVPNCHTEPRHVLAVAHFVIQEYAPIEPDTYGMVWYDLVQCEEEGANS